MKPDWGAVRQFQNLARVRGVSLVGCLGWFARDFQGQGGRRVAVIFVVFRLLWSGRCALGVSRFWVIYVRSVRFVLTCFFPAGSRVSSAVAALSLRGRRLIFDLPSQRSSLRRLSCSCFATPAYD